MQNGSLTDVVVWKTELHFPDHQRDGFLRLLQQGRLNRQCAFRRKGGSATGHTASSGSTFQVPDRWMHPSPPFFTAAQHHTLFSPPRPVRNHTLRQIAFHRPCPVFCPVRDGLLFFPDGFQSPTTPHAHLPLSYLASRASNSARRSDSAWYIPQAGQHAGARF
ncbi:hypothetical protein BANRA_05605 [Klebsiella pneumoniae]|nr:hypothetical protein BANRA_05605 [Klebsiella pneumoniae]